MAILCTSFLLGRFNDLQHKQRDKEYESDPCQFADTSEIPKKSIILDILLACIRTPNQILVYINQMIRIAESKVMMKNE